MSVSGTFEVKLEPQVDDQAPAGRMLIDKVYSGGLVATGIGQMISKRTENGESVYSAIEEVTGELQGKEGSFTLVHFGKMSAAGQELSINIVAGSGSGQLSGITGRMSLKIEGDQHHYVLDYELAD